MKLLKFLPGIVLSLFVAALACFIESLLPIHLIGSAVIAMFIGMILNRFIRNTKIFGSGIKFTSKKILKLAIILLGLSLNIKTILNVGKMSLVVMIFTLLTCFGGGYFIGKALGLNWKLSNLISAGTGICGGSAIIPTVITFSLIQLRLKRKEAIANSCDGSNLKTNFKLSKIFPWFILGFLAMSVVASVFSVPAEVVSGKKHKQISNGQCVGGYRIEYLIL